MGTLLGSLLTYTFQRLTSRRTEQFTRDERLRKERITIYSTFAGAVLDLRLKHAAQWRLDQDEPSDAQLVAEAKRAKDTSRTAAYQAFAQVMLVTDDERVVNLARHSLDLLSHLHSAASSEVLKTRTSALNKAVEEFIKIASAYVR
ncbi:hypothetical protein HCN51_57545 [Nonomuraea sp. FMUSA5-5]|uniref:Uncharacterized protein n=1 Tax=Nonomuraea composti TaxID=2720023 RepID=A0ABX1BW41_9ACTN|nr:hypothetical protein [Nonomuraea sp. FMUSA5-5]NJP98923.1 hypothetical protein [Nonomuraea sp. FMUSA5-5]